MKKKYSQTYNSIIIGIALLLIADIAYSDDYYPNRIIVKFKENSEIGKQWLSQSRNANIPQFSELLGDNVATPFIDNRLMQLLDYNQGNKEQAIASSNRSSIERIARIDYSNSIDPHLAASKIKLFSDVEYAEVETIKRFFYEQPNDPRLSEQYYLGQVKAFDGWKLLDTSKKIILAVVDTGVEYEHEDLFENIYYNEGEIGLDENGNDKRFNGIDDDGNGYVDDWRGWDFYSDGDNDASPGHFHGTHVAGICGAIINNSIGIAGTAPNVKIMAIKTAPDSQFATTIVNGYQGILYAAAMGADVINCSWGSTAYSVSEAEIIDKALSFGSIIVAAAGNDNRNTAHFPASHKGVISVAAVDSNDRAAWFTSYHRTVDVSAPGVGILSTVPLSSYQSTNGTSMASPIAAAIAAMMKSKFPTKSNIQIAELLKVSADNIDSLNPFYAGRIGKGRVNALNALTIENANSIVLNSYNISEEIEDLAYLRNETLSIGISLQNILARTENVYVKLRENGSSAFYLLKDSIYFGNMEELQIINSNENFIIKIKDDVPLDFVAEIFLEIYADGGFRETETISIVLAPSFKTMTGNDIIVTFNSSGNIGYNDYPTNSQGVGFIYQDNPNMLFEGALMLATSDTIVFNSARSTNQMRKENHFYSANSFHIEKPGFISEQDGNAEYEVKYDPFVSIGINITQKVYQYNSSNLQNVIFPIYTLHNQTSERRDSLYLGYYFDWDINNPQRNRIWWDSVHNISFAKCVDYDSIPMASVILLSPIRQNFFAIDNNGNTPENPGVYDGFTREEKRMMLTSGIARLQSTMTDASMVISGGPFSILPNDSITIGYAIIAGFKEQSIVETAREARIFADAAGLHKNRNEKKFNSNAIASVFPLPANHYINVKLAIIDEVRFDLSLYNLQGKKIKQFFSELDLKYGTHYFQFDVSDLPSGAYYLLLEFPDGKHTKSIVVQKEK